jgi:hypothetical protein
MVNKKNIVTVVLLLSFLGLYAQEPSDAQRVNVHFSKTLLSAVLEQLSARYDVQFSYGNDHLKLHQKISFHSEGKNLNATLEQLFTDNNIVYANIGNQLVLKSGKRKGKKQKKRQERKEKREEEKEEREKETLERGTLFDFDIHSEIVGKKELEENVEHEIKRILLSTEEIESLIATKVGGEVSYGEALNSNYKSLVIVKEYKKLKNQIVQVSVLPFLSTNTRNFDKTNILSLNIFWGINGGLNGLEIGGIGNTIKRNVNGMQIGGLFNTANGHLYGTQITGGINITKGDIAGLQIAGLCNLGSNVYGTQISSLANVARDLYGTQFSGLSNIATDVYGFQVSGLFNFANGKLFGSQIAGFGNVAWGGKSAVQFAGVFNTSAKAQVQIATLFNSAQEVEGAQIAAINIAKKVKGVQFGIVNTTKDLKGVQIGIINTAKKAKGLLIGIINVVDSIKGVSIGLINIVKKNGYNRLELSGGDAMYIKFGAKFGAKRLYHILQLGWRVDNRNTHSWSLGLGVGTMININKIIHLNLELISSHINEERLWTKELNLLNQFKLTFDIKLAGQVSFFIGPTFNAQASKLYSEDTREYGSNITPYNLYNKTGSGTNLKMWVGFTGGLRF